jgi:hypothetical protein
MMGNKKLATIRDEVRAALAQAGTGDVDPLSRLLGELQEQPQANAGELEALLLLCDALKREAGKQSASARKGKRTKRVADPKQ